MVTIIIIIIVDKLMKTVTIVTIRTSNYIGSKQQFLWNDTLDWYPEVIVTARNH